MGRLLDENVPFSKKFGDGSSAVRYCVAMGWPCILKRLLDAGADVHPQLTRAKWASSVDAHLALMNAVCKGDTECARLLLRAGVDVNRQTVVTGKTALHEASVLRKPCAELMQLLFDFGADVDLKNWRDITPLMYAAGQRTNSENTRLLLIAGACPTEYAEGINALFCAIKRNTNNVKLLIAAGGYDMMDDYLTRFLTFPRANRSLLEAAARGAADRAAAMRPTAIAAVEARVRALDLNMTRAEVESAADAAALHDVDPAAQLWQLRHWARNLACALAASRAADNATSDCFTNWKEPLVQELAASGTRKRGTVWAMFAVAVARISQCTSGAARYQRIADECKDTLHKEALRSLQISEHLEACLAAPNGGSDD